MNWLIERFKESSTWAGLAVAVAGAVASYFGLQTEVDALGDAVLRSPELGYGGIAAALGGLIAAILKDRVAKPPEPPK